MSLQVPITYFLEYSGFDKRTFLLDRELNNLGEKQVQVEIAIEKSFNKVVTMMRGSYMIVSGMARIIGGGFSRVFQSIWGVAVAAISIQTAIAKAQFFVPGMQLQSVMMLGILTSAIFNMGALMAGQKDLARQARGVNFALHGISSMIGSFYFL
ncbi:hypothetical protein LCGC14_0708620 [marine sediment metagenome]|uniref:Uncharacterized protein n=1 Tax=marine sediment metagenome TaxID=412755 RepID=A0A0F9TNA6_9ZZZZ